MNTIPQNLALQMNQEITIKSDSILARWYSFATDEGDGVIFGEFKGVDMTLKSNNQSFKTVLLGKSYSNIVLAPGNCVGSFQMTLIPVDS